LLKGQNIQKSLRTTGLESDSAINNIHPNNKQTPEITNKNTGKRTVIMASQARCESFFQANFLIFTFIFRGALVNATALTLLLESFARKSDSVTVF